MTSSPTRLLYVDDDRINILLFVEACRPESSLEVVTAVNADDAMDVARETRPDVLVVDLHMPDIDGLQLLGRLRTLPGLARAPAFLCTAELIEEVRSNANAAGFDGVWSKPVDLEGIKRELARVAASAGSSSAVER